MKFTVLLKVTVVVAGAAMLTGCAFTSVLNADKDFNQRVYVGGGVLASHLKPDTRNVPGVSVDESASSGVGVFLGYDLNNRLGIEGHLADLGYSRLSPAGSIAYRVAGVSALIYGFSSEQGRFRKTGFSAFGRLGVGALNNDAKVVRYRRVNDAHLLAGAGIEYGFHNGLALRAELVTHETDAKYVQGSLLYRFGSSSSRSNSAEGVADINASAEQKPLAEQPLVEQASEEQTSAEKESIVEPPLVEEPLVLDSDADGIVDELDECSSTAVGLPVDTVGCEVFGGVIDGVGFLAGSAELTEGAVAVLEDIAKVLKDYPNIKVSIEAHTDSLGEDRENLQLSRRRALAVVRYLADQDIAGSRLVPRAYGESQPRETNATREGRAANRRVEFNIIK